MDEFSVPRVGVGVILVRDGKVLLGKRRNSHGAGDYSFPGGHLELGERVEDCAKREVLEETGLKIQNVRQIGWTDDFFPDINRHYVTLFVKADIIGGVLENKEPNKCESWNWFAREELPQQKFTPLNNLMQQGVDFINM